MRTTVDIDDDVLFAAEERARAQGRTTGAVLSDLAREALSAHHSTGDAEEFLGFRPLPPRGHVVTDEVVDAIRSDTGD